MLSTSFLTVKFEQSSTPLFHQKCNLPSRNLWRTNKTEQGRYCENWSNYHNKEKEIWDGIESPQFIDFNDIPEIRDSFFDKTAIASTPIPDDIAPRTISAQVPTDLLIGSLNNVSISDTEKHDSAERKKEPNIIIQFDGKNSDEKKDFVLNVNQKLDIPNKQDKKLFKKSECTTANPSGIALKKNSKEDIFARKEVRLKLFKANPVPKFLKSRVASDKIKDEDKEIKQKTKDTEKPPKKNTEVWKREPFVPRPCAKIRERPKTPPLQTAIRAKERKRFEEILKEKEKDQERRRQLEEMKKKKQEEEEIAKLRKETVHKAQPIRRYKLGLPIVQKRPLTDPTSPRLLKRRRHA